MDGSSRNVAHVDRLGRVAALFLIEGSSQGGFCGAVQGGGTPEPPSYRTENCKNSHDDVRCKGMILTAVERRAVVPLLLG